MILTNQRNVGAVKFSELRYADAKAMAVYAAYLFEKLVYGDNPPKAEYNRKLEVIKTLSAKDIKFVNSKVADKLEKVYTILKEMASEKANACEQSQEVDAEKSADELLEKIKQTSSENKTVDQAEVMTASVDEFIDQFNKPEVQQAIAEIEQKPSLLQRIKNWFTN